VNNLWQYPARCGNQGFRDVQSAAMVWRNGNDATMKHQGKREQKKKGKCTKDASKFKKEVYLEKGGVGRCYGSDIELDVDIIHYILSLEPPVLSHLSPFFKTRKVLAKY
jgi:hypothetical protein